LKIVSEPDVMALWIGNALQEVNVVEVHGRS
jgi:hypothetical protein